MSAFPDAIDGLTADLTALYEIHDFFHSPVKGEKKALLEEAARKVLDGVAALEGDDGSRASGACRARLAYIRGRALDACEGYSADAEAALSRAVKLAPDDWEAWNALAHSFWKKGDLAQAHASFESAQKQRPNKVSLRQLSMLTRQMVTGPAATGGSAAAAARANAHATERALAHAKSALALDWADPESWYVLGNAHIARFFRVSHAPADAERALASYAKAEQCGKALCDARADAVIGDVIGASSEPQPGAGSFEYANPDLHFNRANLLRYVERHADAVADYRKALALDPSLPALDAMRAVAHKQRRAAELIARRGRVKPKRLRQLAALAKAATAPDGAALTPLASLAVGENPAKAVALTVVLPVQKGAETPPDVFLLVGAPESADAPLGCIALSLYNADSSRISERAVVTVVDPVVTEIAPIDAPAADDDDESGVGPCPGYRTITVTDPAKLLIDRAPLRPMYQNVLQLDNPEA